MLTTLQPTTTAHARRALGLDAVELEELLQAVGDREEHVGTDARQRLAAGRRALELELAATLEN